MLGSEGGLTGASTASGAQLESSQTIEDIVSGSEQFNPREMGQVVEKYGVGEEVLKAMPMLKTPAKISTTLLPYQSQGLAWMLSKAKYSPTIVVHQHCDHLYAQESEAVSC